MKFNPFQIVGKTLMPKALDMGKAAGMVKSSVFWITRSKLELKRTFGESLKIGVNSLPVVFLTSFFTGMVLALQAGSTSKDLFNEPMFIGALVGFSLVKELGPVLTSIVISGRAGAAITAEIGTMQVTDQIDALYMLGTNPIKYLVIPRYIACIVMIPLLTVCANASGIIGGFLISNLKLGVPSSTYWDEILTFMKIKDYMHGFLKSFVFAFMIATVCCYKGLSTRGGAEGVGRSTTQAVVISMVMVLVLDYFATAILVAIGI
jgi:phospholipid/cholesterol/gamma-HCH transport system permease protein